MEPSECVSCGTPFPPEQLLFDAGHGRWATTCIWCGHRSLWRLVVGGAVMATLEANPKRSVGAAGL